MNLTKRQVRFLKPARSKDPYRKGLRSMWCIKHRKVAVATDGFVLHALPITEPSCDFAFRDITDVNGQAGFSLSNHPEEDAPKIDFAKPKARGVSMYINPKLLQRTLNALDGHNSMRLSVVRFGGVGWMLVLQGIEDNVGPYYAEIMGMHPGSMEKSEWGPWGEEIPGDRPAAEPPK